MARRDYYKVLEVPRDATQDQIKRAYRTLAARYHPDVNKAPDAQARFTEVQEAYDVLSDEGKRRQYDRFGRATGSRAGPSVRYSWTNVGGDSGGGVGIDMDDLGSMFDAYFGAGPGGGFGSGIGSGRRGAPRAGARPQTRAEVHVDFMTAARGGTQTIRVADAGGPRTIEVTIPRAIADGARLRLRGKGRGGGDLILTVRVGRHPLFRRSESDGGQLDLALDLPLTLAEATLGAKVRVPILDGEVDLSVPPGTSSGTRLRLRGRGLRDENGRCGDLYAVVQIVVPEAGTLGDEDRRALERIESRQGSPRHGPGWPG